MVHSDLSLSRGWNFQTLGDLQRHVPHTHPNDELRIRRPDNYSNIRLRQKELLRRCGDLRGVDVGLSSQCVVLPHHVGMGYSPGGTHFSPDFLGDPGDARKTRHPPLGGLWRVVGYRNSD